MKVGQPITPVQVKPVKTEPKAKEQPKLEEKSEVGVLVEVSARNAVAATNLESTGAELSSIKAAINANPETAVLAQSHSAPERVLQLLA
ncbi:hypothetical protein FACS1894202_00170 [Clostridia bacterium]|nr:hypothetical protein FACS1894202_00170 [Clostridia bacterium]